ncbi:MAG TPA: archaellin/type IV pilin N-terminal domain-containing protein [archaeon]|nr:archaellin/type IV pilin N-terminal domain-containing protein [archaeon]
MKGVSSMIAAVLLVLITIVASVFLSGWLTSTSSAQAERIKNNTNTQLQCQFADMYIKNVTYSCGGNCTTGTQHTTTVTLVNSGKKSLSISSIYILNTTGVVTVLNLNETKTLSVSDALTITNTSRDTCSGINGSIEAVTVSSLNCPATAYDSADVGRITYASC